MSLLEQLVEIMQNPSWATEEHQGNVYTYVDYEATAGRVLALFAKWVEGLPKSTMPEGLIEGAVNYEKNIRLATGHIWNSGRAHIIRELVKEE